MNTSSQIFYGCQRCLRNARYNIKCNFSTQSWRSYPRLRSKMRPPTSELPLAQDLEQMEIHDDININISTSQAKAQPLPPPPPPAPTGINQTFKSSKIDREEGFVFKPPEPTMTSTAYRWDTAPPTLEQLRYAERFFEKYPVRFMWSADEFAKMPDGPVPEVAFLGRSNVGKSSILNALMNQKGMARTSARPGRTRQMNAFSVGGARLTLLDMPGYGHGSRASWGREIMEYLRGRKQFRRAFLLIDPVHGFKDVDYMILEAFVEMGIPYQLVLSKTDKLDNPKAKKTKKTKIPELSEILMQVQKIMEEYGGHAGYGEILATASQPVKLGINDLRWAVLRASGLEGKRK
ncbi:hypothetical protein TWF694_010946 [Orbilia ellipsospora]|uniref:GTP-binding protein 8 n=1 Tax=Orbilia ellipsospora TaxID=2528407 RepID=A0AAV9X8W8_9PEZI